MDVSSASRLADLDPALALLPRALPRPSQGARWALHDVRWTPGRGCRLAYHVRSAQAPASFVAVDVTADGWSSNDYCDDPRLTGLPSASDPIQVAGLLAEVVDAPLRRCLVEPVRYRPGSRCVLRYDVDTAGGSRTFYGKVLRPERFAATTATAIALADPAVGSRLVPELVAQWPGLHALVSAGVPGRVASALLADAAAPARRRAALGHRLGDLLAGFHEQRGISAPHRSGGDHLAELAASADVVRLVDARLADRLARVLEQLAARVPARGAEVLAHGGFRAGQVLVGDDGRLVVLDTDGVCCCDPGRDLGMVLAHLVWQGIRQPGQRCALRGVEQALVSGYLARSAPPDPIALSWWRAVGLLQVAVRRFRRLETAFWGLAPALVDAAADALADQRTRTTPRRGTDPADVRTMSDALRPAVAPGSSRPESVHIASAHELASAPGRRSVVRYSVDGLDGGQPVELVAKTFSDGRRAELLHDHLRRLHDGPFGTGSLRVPETVAFLAPQRVVVYRHCPGTPLDRVADPAQREDGVRGAARWLARLHASDVPLARTFSLRQEADSTQRWAALIGAARPELSSAARDLADRWARVVGSCPPAVADVPIHKDFHPGHVLVGEALYVIDLDEARRGDPAFDVAHFCAYLELTGSDGDSPVGRAFLEEYVAATGWRDTGTFDAFRAYSWLKIAKQWTVGSTLFRDAGPAQRSVGAAHALAKGHACLGR